MFKKRTGVKSLMANIWAGCGGQGLLCHGKSRRYGAAPVLPLGPPSTVSWHSRPFQASGRSVKPVCHSSRLPLLPAELLLSLSGVPCWNACCRCCYSCWWRVLMLVPSVSGKGQFGVHSPGQGQVVGRGCCHQVHCQATACQSKEEAGGHQVRCLRVPPFLLMLCLCSRGLPGTWLDMGLEKRP